MKDMPSSTVHTKQKKWAHGSPSTQWLDEEKTSINLTSGKLLVGCCYLSPPPSLPPSITSIPVVLIHPQVTLILPSTRASCIFTVPQEEKINHGMVHVGKFPLKIKRERRCFPIPLSVVIKNKLALSLPLSKNMESPSMPIVKKAWLGLAPCWCLSVLKEDILPLPHISFMVSLCLCTSLKWRLHNFTLGWVMFTDRYWYLKVRLIYSYLSINVLKIIKIWIFYLSHVQTLKKKNYDNILTKLLNLTLFISESYNNIKNIKDLISEKNCEFEF